MWKLSFNMHFAFCRNLFVTLEKCKSLYFFIAFLNFFAKLQFCSLLSIVWWLYNQTTKNVDFANYNFVVYRNFI